MRTGKLFLIGSFAVLGAALTSCSKTDVFDSNAEIEKQKDDYASTFVKKYGEIDPNQSWDFCTMAPSYSLESSSRALTRDGDANVNADAVEGEMFVEKATVDWMSENLKAGTIMSRKVSLSSFRFLRTLSPLFLFSRVPPVIIGSCGCMLMASQMIS